MCVCTAEQRQNRREGSGEEPTQESDGCAHQTHKKLITTLYIKFGVKN